MDCHFPIIQYAQGKSPREWGRAHGEAWRQAIVELAEIRETMMLNLKPQLKPHLKTLAQQQFEVSKNFDADIAEELIGIAEGANLGPEKIVILNNYTDFRDIQLPDEGCSTVHVQSGESIWTGQTWDMHRSAKNYVCLIQTPESLSFSLVGCVGMMGFNRHLSMIGVNNINTNQAKAGLIWPLLVRHVLKAKGISGLREALIEAPVTSGHSYILSAPDGGEIWEVCPNLSEKTDQARPGEEKVIFHTNHCLAEKMQERETPSLINSTTRIRYDLIEKKQEQLKSFDSLLQLFQDHDRFPQSICSHFESGSQDPSFTCGGGVGDLQEKRFIFWRGCKVHDDNYVQHDFVLEGDQFRRVGS